MDLTLLQFYPGITPFTPADLVLIYTSVNERRLDSKSFNKLEIKTPMLMKILLCPNRLTGTINKSQIRFFRSESEKSCSSFFFGPP